MRNSTATEPTRLLNPWALVLVTIAVGALLILTFKSEDVFVPDGKQPDAVSASYAELLLNAHPEDEELRLKLIELLVQLGDYAKAKEHLQALQGSPLAAQPFYSVELDLLQALADPAGVPPQMRLALAERLRGLQREPLSQAQLERLARHALALEAPDVAARAYVELAARDPEQRLRWLTEAARCSMASGQAEQAAQLYLELAELEADSNERRTHLELAFNSLLAAERGERAVELLARELNTLQGSDADFAWLATGVSAAQGASRFDLAEAFLERWLALRPADADALLRDFQLQLASGHLEHAWAVGQQLLPERQSDSRFIESLARLAEWTGRQPEALALWMQRLQLGDEASILQRTWRLATQMFDFDNAITLLAKMGEQRQLNEEELNALVYSHESRGTPEAAEHWLRTYLERYPGHQLAWQRLQQNLENTRQLREEADCWAAYSQHFLLSLRERMQWAESLWRVFDAEGAWEVLDALDTAAVTDEQYWRLRASLAWELERDDDARHAYERLAAIGVELDSSESDQLLALYRASDPRKSLELLVASWERSGDPRRLVYALQVAEQLQDWSQLQTLLEDAARVPATAREPYVLASRAAFAEHQGQDAQAERLYREGLSRFPGDALFPERLLWFHIDRGQREPLPQLLQDWRAIARQDNRLWLPFASANQLLGRAGEALAWYRLYLKTYDQDWLVQAAYTDALEADGRLELAQRLRRRLLVQFDKGTAPVTPESYATYLRLLAGSYSPMHARRQADRGLETQSAMLDIWFGHLLEQLSSNNQEGLKSEWLAWARDKGLAISRHEQVQDALRTSNRAQIERLLAQGALDPAQRVEALGRLGHGGEALGASLTEAGDDPLAVVQQQLLRQAVELHQRFPQGDQLGWLQRDYGGVELDGPRLAIARSLGDDWHAAFDFDEADYTSDSLDSSAVGRERTARLELQRQLSDGGFSLSLDSSWRSDDTRNGLGLSRHWQLTSRDELELDLDWHRQTEESGLMRALGQRDGLGLAGRHSFSARDQLSWSLAHKRFNSLDGDALGKGEALNLEFNHTLFFERPTWVVRGGVDYQRNRLPESLPASLLVANGGALSLPQAGPEDLLQERYGQVYAGSTIRRGFPGAMNRETSQYSWLLDLAAGWQWTESNLNYGITFGVGAELLGDDELAFTLGYQSAPQSGDGEAGGTIGVSYSARFGR